MQHRLIRPQLEAFAEARADLHAMRFQHLCELADLHKEIEELRSIVADVVTGLRQSADNDVARSRRALERALLRLAPDPHKPLN
jgi:hypothetical protein